MSGTQPGGNTVPPVNNGLGFRGFQEPDTASDRFNAHSFLIKSMLSRVRTATLVQVQAVTNAGGLTAVGMVNILPLVNQTDGAGNVMPHATIFACPYLRIQGGANAVILDPQVGDIGIAVFADRDISSVTANQAQANPGSRRQHDMADALYLGGVLNGVPTQYVQFNASGLTLVSPNSVTIQAPNIMLAGNVASIGTFTNNGHAIGSTHEHSGVATGMGTSGMPV
jgi:hypothetical protein